MKLPKIIEEVGFDFNWSSAKVWTLNIASEEMDISKLTWHFDIPFWDIGKKRYILKPNEILEDPEKHKLEYKRTMNSDLRHPIDIMQNKGRWLNSMDFID